MQPVISELQAAQIGEILINEPLASYTTWKIGGPADVLLIPKGKEELIATILILHRHGLPWTTIGKGSNLLIRDKGIRGVVVKVGAGLETLVFEGSLVHAGSAFGFITLSVLAGKRGLTGLEFAGGIPGTVGGAVYMNAGAHGSDVSGVLKEAEVLWSTGKLETLKAEDLQFAYRHSLLHSVPGIVVGASFNLALGDRKEIAAAMASNKERRIKTQPLQLACAGSVFRNPEHQFAAKLIEEAGLKGIAVGGAEISRLHANFIVNTGHATAQDVLTLMELIQTKVFELNQVQLVREVMVVGER